MRRQRVPMPIRVIGGRKFRLHCTRVVIAPYLEKLKLEEKGYETHLEKDGAVWKLWKEVRRE